MPPQFTSSSPSQTQISLPSDLINLSNPSLLKKLLLRLYQSPHHQPLRTSLSNHLSQQNISLNQKQFNMLYEMMEILVYSNDMSVVARYGIEKDSHMYQALEDVLPTLRAQDSNWIKIPFMKRVSGIRGRTVLREKMGESKGDVRWRGTVQCGEEEIEMEMDRSTVELVLNGMKKIQEQLKLVA